jgi:hypothetical protein
MNVCLYYARPDVNPWRPIFVAQSAKRRSSNLLTQAVQMRRGLKIVHGFKRLSATLPTKMVPLSWITL